MAQKLEAIRGGGGSIKVGTTGTISALMSRELESVKSASSSASTSGETSRRPKPATSADEASSSTSSATGSFKNHENSRRKHHINGTPRIPMLESYDASVDRTPIRKKAVKKGHGIVEIVDIKCRVNPITHRLKKLSFSRLSDSTNV